MPQSCDLCGRQEVKYRARVAGMEAIVCPRCATHGEIIEEFFEATPREVRKAEQAVARQERRGDAPAKVDEVLENIGAIVKAKREELGLKQDELGKKANEQGSMIARIEHGYVPSVQIARKLEKVLHVKLVETVNADEPDVQLTHRGGATTLGDIMVIRKEKK